MPGKVFIDSNVAIYLYSEDEPKKRAIAQALMRDSDTPWISTQVLSELASVLWRKFKLGYGEIAEAVTEIRGACNLHLVTSQTISLALQLGAKYGYAYYDCLILAAALECGAETVFSEDMQDGQLIERRLLIRNPFV